MPRPVLFLIGTTLLILVAAITLMVMGYENAAWVVGNFGTLGLFLGMLAYVVLWDSRKKWPNLTVGERATKVLTFQR